MIAKTDYEEKANVLVICARCNWKGFVKEAYNHCLCPRIHCPNAKCGSRRLIEVGIEDKTIEAYD